MFKTKLALAVISLFFAISANAAISLTGDTMTNTTTSTATATASGNTNTMTIGGGDVPLAQANGGQGGQGGKGGNGGTGIGIGGNQHQTAKGGNASASNGGNSQTTNIEASKTYRPPVSSAYAPTIFPTAPCMGSSSVGVSATMIGISLGSTWTSEECLILETARGFDQAGYVEDGLNVRCQAKYAKVAPSCKALKDGKYVAHAPVVVVAPVAYEALPEIAPNDEVLVLEPLTYNRKGKE